MVEKEKGKESRALARWDPFSELDLWEGFGPFREFGLGSSRLARMMEEMFGMRPARAGRLVPALDIAEDDDGYVVTIELPGAKREDVTVECQDNVLTIRGEKKSEREEKKEQHRWVERTYGSFSRSFTLPPNARADQIKANFKEGVLTLTIPKAEEAKPKVINIQS
jgi:HSP20 family protein